MMKQNEIKVSGSNLEQNYEIPMMEICCFETRDIVTVSDDDVDVDESEGDGW